MFRYYRSLIRMWLVGLVHGGLVHGDWFSVSVVVVAVFL